MDLDGNRKVIRAPFSDKLAISGLAATQAITKMRLFQEIGWPEARMALRDSQGHPLIAKKADPIWLLKCKPSCWRLYFYVLHHEKEKWIIYVHAICKKADKENPQDAREARRVVERIRSRASCIRPFVFPTG
jgi:hypothetical protein